MRVNAGEDRALPRKRGGNTRGEAGQKGGERGRWLAYVVTKLFRFISTRLDTIQKYDCQGKVATRERARKKESAEGRGRVRAE